METFYSFTWAPRPRGGENRGPRRDRAAAGGERPAGDRKPRAEGQKPEAQKRGDGHGQNRGEPRPPRPEGGYKGKGKGGKPGGKGDRGAPKPQKFESHPPRPEKKIDPDNPFAALAALKGKI
tara:strand:- start:282 stop:647 length:366 start_codon:yes stop_codon:yes gene_type:complete